MIVVLSVLVVGAIATAMSPPVYETVAKLVANRAKWY